VSWGGRWEAAADTAARCLTESEPVQPNQSDQPLSHNQAAPNTLTPTTARWDDDVFVARAPGRLDVMGGGGGAWYWLRGCLVGWGRVS